MKIDVGLSYNNPTENMTRIRNVILVCGTSPKAVFTWLDFARPLAVLDAAQQTIFGIVDAAVSAIRAKQKGDGYDFVAALARVNAVCKQHIGEVN